MDAPFNKYFRVTTLAACFALVPIVSYSLYSFFRLGDDTYIYLQYAKHILNNGDIAFNAGVVSYGFTSPLWLMMMTFAIKLSGSYLFAPEALTLLCTLATVLIWYKIILRVNPEKWLFLFLMAIAAFDPNLILHSLFGMEASLCFLLSSVLILCIFGERPKFTAFGAAAGLLFLTRPESAIVSFILFIYLIVARKSGVKNLFFAALAAIITVIPWMIFSLKYFGHTLPDTFAAKGGAFPLGTRFVQHIIDTINIFGGRYGFLVLGALLAFFLIRRWTAEIAAAKTVIFGLVIFYALTMSNEYVYARYYCLVFPFVLFILTELFSSAWPARPWTRTVLIVLFVLHFFSNTWLAAEKKEVFENSKKDFDTLVAWTKKFTRPDDAIITGAIGRIAFETDREIVDPLGLVNPEIVEFNQRGAAPDYYRKRKPRFAIGRFDELLKSLEQYADITVLQSAAMGKTISLRDRFGSSFAVTDTMRIYQIDWKK